MRSYTLSDRIEDALYLATIVWPARWAPRACIRAAGITANTGLRLGWRQLARSATRWAYDVADHDPADATWELHRDVMPWAWADQGVFRPERAMGW